jgi:hypothetical protein
MQGLVANERLQLGNGEPNKSWSLIISKLIIFACLSVILHFCTQFFAIFVHHVNGNLTPKI